MEQKRWMVPLNGLYCTYRGDKWLQAKYDVYAGVGRPAAWKPNTAENYANSPGLLFNCLCSSCRGIYILYYSTVIYLNCKII